MTATRPRRQSTTPLIQAARPGAPAAARFLRANSSGLPPQGAWAWPWRPPHSASSCAQQALWLWWWRWRWWWSAPAPPPQQEGEDDEEEAQQEQSSCGAVSRSMSLSWRLRCGPGLVEEDEQVVAVVDAVGAAAMEPNGSACARAGGRPRFTARPSLGATA